jgi:hypothetical protein
MTNTNRFAVTATLLAIFSSLAVGQVSGSIESENLIAAGAVTPQINVYVQGPIASSKRFGWSAWSLTSKAWSEAYAGPTWTPRPWLSLSVSAGAETNKHPLRVAGSVSASKGKWAESYVHEKGGSGWWYKSVSTYQASKKTAVGFFSQRFAGSGPYAERKISRFVLWGTLLRYQGKTEGLVGLRFNFPQ